VVELARRHLGLRRTPGLRVRVGDGRAIRARRAGGTADAILVDAFVGARVAAAIWSTSWTRDRCTTRPRSPPAVLGPEEMPAFIGGMPAWRD
jgi:hypothetical protein